MAAFGKKGVSNQGGNGRIDARRPVETGQMPKRNTSWLFQHNKDFIFWAFVIGIALVPIGFYFHKGEPLMGSWYKSAGFVSFGIFMAFYLRATGHMDDKPETDIRGFFLGGPWFLSGAALAAGAFFWLEGISWIWSYDLTNVSFDTGIQQLGQGLYKEPEGLSAFLGNLTTLLIMSLAGGALVKQIAVKIGIDEPFETDSDGQN